MIVAQKPDRFVVHWDERRGSAMLELQGFWSLEDARDFHPAVEKVIAQSRARHGYALLLFDLGGSEVASGALIENFEASGSRFVQQSDRVALVFSSTLLKIQIKRMNPLGEGSAYFASRHAADLWLHAPVEGLGRAVTPDAPAS